MPSAALYVLQVKGGAEERMRERICSVLSDIVQDCFIPEYETMWASRGEWHPVRAKLFPGYLFVQTSDPVALAGQLSTIPSFARLLGANGEQFIPLTDDEIAWVNVFTTADTHLVEMSRGFIEGDTVTVVSGPLRGHEAQIAKIDRHKRLAVLDVQMFGRTKQVKVGLEIVWKRT